jgi:hypothetical protein
MSAVVRIVAERRGMLASTALAPVSLADYVSGDAAIY